MRFDRSSFGFDDLFTLAPVTRHAPRAPFLDLRFIPSLDMRHRDRVRGPGLYGVFFLHDDAQAHELVYVGKFRGRKGDPSGGNAVQSRWWAHGASLTLRGHRISVNPRTLAALPRFLPPMHRYRDLAEAREISKDRGCQAGLNRVLFAADHDVAFARLQDCAATRARFRFAYLRIVAHDLDIAGVRNLVGIAERRLIAQLRPRCNDEIAPGTHRRVVTQDRFLAAAGQSLNEARQTAPCVVASTCPPPSSRMPGPPPASAL